MGASVAHTPLGLTHEDVVPAVINRCTKDGRKLWYKLTVIQQPERARACGSGPKSSADRRPVDPPPVVELRIFEGQSWQEAQQKDITFTYNANFFLFTTLEHARVMAHGRVPAPAANQPPVLTGMPVSGMAYLDRPIEAGYFLFPDLSVRHEGRYRLTFNLYEETKEDKDKDLGAPESKTIVDGFHAATSGSFDYRMEVKSGDFVVYSAKKFPGLNLSTELSKLISDQGCRVRIRRDVRMRRRDRKGADHDNCEDGYNARRRTETPEVRAYRDRSMSRSHEMTPYAAETSRRPSGADYPPPFGPQQSSSGGHLHFLGPMSNPQCPPQPPSIPQSPSHQTGPASLPYAQLGGYVPPAQPPYGYVEPPRQTYAPTHLSPQQREPAAPHRRPSEDSSRRQSSASMRPSNHEYADFNNPMVPDVTAAQDKITLPPIEIPKTPAPVSAPLTAASAASGAAASAASAAGPSPSRMMPPLVSPSNTYLPKPLPHGGGHVGSHVGGAAPPAVPPLMTTPVAGSKRPRDEPFRSGAEGLRYRNGAREHPREKDNEDGTMVYVRADGSQQARQCVEY